MKTLKTIAVAIIATSSVSANAMNMEGLKNVFNNDNPVAISAEAGTLGYGANVAWSVNDTTEVQVGWTGGDIAKDVEIEVENVDYTAETDFSTPYVAVQLKPLKNWFTVGAGVMHMGNNSIEATATPKADTSFTYEGKDYVAKADSKLDAKINFRNTVAPYVSVGFRPNINNRFGVFGELGAAYVGKLNTNVKASGSYSYKGQKTDLTPAQIADLENRARNEIEEKISANGEWYPVVKLGATVRF